MSAQMVESIPGYVAEPFRDGGGVRVDIDASLACSPDVARQVAAAIVRAAEEAERMT